jgi:thiamine pyrophosphokinase
MQQTFVVMSGGPPPHAAVVAHLPDHPFVIAADSGLDHAYDLGLDVQLVVGDLDSVSKEALDAAETAGVPVERHPTAKDAIDTELAVDAALARGARRIVVVAGGGGRFDQLVAGLLVLARPVLADVDIEAWVGPAYVQVLHGPGHAALTGRPGAYVSLLAMSGVAEGVTTSGLRYPLHGEALLPGSSRGISNEFEGGEAAVAVERGVLVAVVPDALGGTS